MKLHILSDLHLEFAPFLPEENDAEVVILAGDIGSGVDGVYWAREVFPDQEIVYVPGNHEFYGFDRTDLMVGLRRAARDCRIHLLENDALVIGDVRILGATLWTDFELFGADQREESMWMGEMYLNDFSRIHEGLELFTPGRSVELHVASAAWLRRMLDETFTGKTVVVSHHLPSMLSVAERFKVSELSACFASNLDDLFGRMPLWVHGHTHDNFDYVSNGTRVVCNPRGYVTRNGVENIGFKSNLVVEV